MLPFELSIREQKVKHCIQGSALQDQQPPVSWACQPVGKYEAELLRRIWLKDSSYVIFVKVVGVCFSLFARWVVFAHRTEWWNEWMMESWHRDAFTLWMTDYSCTDVIKPTALVLHVCSVTQRIRIICKSDSAPVIMLVYFRARTYFTV